MVTPIILVSRDKSLILVDLIPVIPAIFDRILLEFELIIREVGPLPTVPR